ncbi:MAG TPA: NlpC/P60 family protein [Gaiellaceae bacterium]|nr:NlpC/P60 family protein [Gaiellaceae bacterium]
MRRALMAFLALLAAFVAAHPAAGASWAKPQIRIVVEHGLMGPSVKRFHPRANVTHGELGAALAAFTGNQQVVVDPGAEVSIAELDAAVVGALGLGHAARLFRREVKAAGLRPPRRLGTEVVARLLWLRLNHPLEDDALELRPQDPATRAETAYSLARALAVSDWERDSVRSLADSFSLPSYGDWRRRVLRRAVHFIGYPYVWGGLWEHEQVTFGVTSRGGFDCSGFAWRVYKLRPFSGGGSLSSVLQGRTTYEMSGEVPKAKRIPFHRVKPADLLFFGADGPRSRPSEVDHMGIGLGNGWMIHSSSQGVAFVPLTGWYRDRFAWARRPLREAGLL